MHLLAAAAGGANQGTITQIFMGAAALVGAFTAWRVSKRDTNAESLREATKDLRDAKRRIDDLEDDILDMRNWQFAVRQQAAAAGLSLPEPPVLRSEHTS